jgi:hypothetical protein
MNSSIPFSGEVIGGRYGLTLTVPNDMSWRAKANKERFTAPCSQTSCRGPLHIITSSSVPFSAPSFSFHRPGITTFNLNNHSPSIGRTHKFAPSHSTESEQRSRVRESRWARIKNGSIQLRSRGGMPRDVKHDRVGLISKSELVLVGVQQTPSCSELYCETRVSPIYRKAKPTKEPITSDAPTARVLGIVHGSKIRSPSICERGYIQGR